MSSITKKLLLSVAAPVAGLSAFLAAQPASALNFDVIYTFDGNLAATETADANNLVQFSNLTAGGAVTANATPPNGNFSNPNQLVATFPNGNLEGVNANFFSFVITPETPTSSVSVTNLFFEFFAFNEATRLIVAASNDGFTSNEIILDQNIPASFGVSFFDLSNLNTTFPGTLSDKFAGAANIEFRFFSSVTTPGIFPGERVVDSIRVRGVPFEFEGGIGLAALTAVSGFALWRKRSSNNSAIVENTVEAE
ncbi:MAG: hypothetical protein HC919_08675 [Oscillatoriales cyanobacterium SM2_2_1]|nr:hypothetical protein [Oscillatoriales cyanobacterium SM2_2_1]